MLRMMRRQTRLVKSALVRIGLFGVAIMAVPGITFAGVDIEVTSTIQAAVDAANPGDTVLVPPGTYRESVLVTRNDITIVGSHTAVIDAEGFGTGIRVGIGRITTVDGVPVCPALAVKNFTLKGLTIKNARFSGVFLIGVDRYRLTGSMYIDNPTYGPFPLCSRHGLIDDNFVKGGNASSNGPSIDAGIYVGDDDTVKVTKNVVTNHAIGIEIESSMNAVVRENVLSGNTTGIVVVVLPGLPLPRTDNVRIESNLVFRNNLANPVPVESGDPVGLLPTGTGILNIGGDHVIVRNNRVIGNDSLGVAIIRNPFASADPRIEPNPDSNEVRDNVILHNGRNPDPIRATTPGVDIFYDGTGMGTCFARNVFETEFPASITASFPCPERDEQDHGRDGER